jgi:magnesium transporter
MTGEETLARAFLASHAARAAMLLERMPASHAAGALRAVPVTAAADALQAMTPTRAAGVLTALTPVEAAPMVAELPVDGSAAIVRLLEGAPRERLLSALPEASREPVERVLGFPPGTAGAVMDPAILTLPEDVLVADARVRLRHAARGLLYYLYVTDRAHRLVGVLDIPELMLARPRDPVGAAMHRDVDRLSAWMPVSLVREHAGWHRYHAMPVVDEHQRLVGAIRYQTLRRLEREAADRGPEPALLTARALGELFRLGTTGLVAGIAAAAPAGASGEAPPDPASPAAAGGLHAP